MESIRNGVKHIRQYMADVKRFGQLSAEQIIALGNIEVRLRSIEDELEIMEMHQNGELDCLYGYEDK